MRFPLLIDLLVGIEICVSIEGRRINQTLAIGSITGVPEAGGTAPMIRFSLFRIRERVSERKRKQRNRRIENVATFTKYSHL